MDKSKIIEMFINEPEKEFYVREIARASKLAPTTVSNYLKELKKKKILVSEKRYNHLLFRASQNSDFKQAKQNYNLEIIQKSGLLDFLIEEYEPEAVILFGSFAKADSIKSSDIDILIISPRKKQINLEKYEKILGHKIQIFIHSRQEINKIKEKSPELVNNWINGIKLRGFLELFK